MNISFLKKLRTIGMIEGTSTLILFGVAMPMKYLGGMPMAVTVAGSVHGALFVVLAVMCIIAIWKVPIGTGLGVWGIVGAVVPFGPFIVDRWLRKLEATGDETETLQKMA